jgi:glycosyltransferase involved in cell wall biosynthesis
MATPRVTLDIQALQSEAHAERGIGRYVASHARALLHAGAPIERFALNPLLAAPKAMPASIATSGRVAWATERVFDDVGREGPFVHHVMSPFEDVRPVDGLVTPPAFRRARAIVVTLYDVIPYVMAAEYQRSWWATQFLRRRAALLHRADLVCTISQSAARDAIDVLDLDPDRVVVIGSAVSDHFRLPQPGEDVDGILRRAVPQLRRPFLLAVTGDDPRKDPLGLIDAFAALPSDLRAAHQLVMVCTLMPATEQQWREHAAQQRLGPDDVVFTGYTAGGVLRALYQRTRLLVFNSRREGFGLPVLEAVTCGAIAITADNSSLPEVLDEPESRYPTGDVDALVDLMQRALTDDALRTRLATSARRATSQHRWEKVAEATIAGYERFADHRGAASRRSRTSRVALVGPFAPASSGIADYNERVAAALAPMATLDCFADVDPPYTRGATAGRRFSVNAFDRTFSPARYDSVVYTLGNSRFHRATFEHALAYPGVVWLHDACLAGLYLTRAGLYLPGVATEAIDFDEARAFMRAALVRCTGRDDAWLGDDWWKPEAYVDAGVLMLDEVLRVARAVIVSSDAARRIVEARLTTSVPVHVVPLAIPDPPDAITVADDEPPWVVSLGVVSTVKRLDDLIRAFARVAATTPARLAIVGNADPHYAAELVDLARSLGIGARVTVTGLVEPDEYAAWVQRATVVVQLRTRSVGEGSATVTDALAAHRAVVTNVGSAVELPAGVVDRVPVDIGVDDLSSRLERLLRDDEYRGALERAAARFAQTHSFADVAQRVLDIVRSTSEPAYPEPLAAPA